MYHLVTRAAGSLWLLCELTPMPRDSTSSTRCNYSSHIQVQSYRYRQTSQPYRMHATAQAVCQISVGMSSLSPLYSRLAFSMSCWRRISSCKHGSSKQWKRVQYRGMTTAGTMHGAATCHKEAIVLCETRTIVTHLHNQVHQYEPGTASSTALLPCDPHRTGSPAL